MSNSGITSTVVVIDNDKDRGKGMMQAFTSQSCIAIHLWKDGRGKIRISGENNNIPTHCTVLLWHVGDITRNWIKISADQVIYYSGNGGNDERFPVDTQERIWRPVKIGPIKPDSGVLSSAEAEKLLSYVNDWTADNHNLIKPSFLEQSNHYLPALAMLCQGYLAIHAYQETATTSKWNSQETVKVSHDLVWDNSSLFRMAELWVHQSKVDKQKAHVCQASWWLGGLMLLNDQCELITSRYQNFLEAIGGEWTRYSQDNSPYPAALQTLVSAMATQDKTRPMQVADNLSIEPKIVADAFYTIANQFPITDLTQKEDQISLETAFEYILAFNSCPISMAFSTVLALFLDAHLFVLDKKTLSEVANLSKDSLILLTEDQLNRLPLLRLHNFSGAVLVLSNSSFDSIKQKYPILRWGQGSHLACSFLCPLSNLLSQVAKLFPMEPENLAMLQNQLQAPIFWLQDKIMPLLGKLQQDSINAQQHLDELADIIQELRLITPVVHHTEVEIGGQTAQIQQHFQTKLKCIRNSKKLNPQDLDLLKQVFEQWRSLVVEVGEGQETFS